MFDNLGGNTLVTMTVLVFVTVLLMIEGLYLVWRSYKGPQARKIEKRLQAFSAASDRTQQAHLAKERMLSDVPWLQRMLLTLPRAHRLDRVILQAGLEWTVSSLLLACAVLGVLAFVVMGWLLRQPLVLTLVATAVAALLPMLYLQRQRSRRLARMEKQLPDALDLVTRALRAGHSFASGVQMIGDEMADPIASEFRMVADEVNFGVSLQQALTNLSERVPLTDLRYFVVAVLIQRDSGGNLTEVLGNLSRLIRERLKLLARVRVLSSEGRLSAWILGLMPFALAGLMNLFNPEFMSPLWEDPAGQVVVKYMLILMLVGVVILRKIVKIRV
ncbi:MULTISPECIES: type II secretion system F family protein [unclassified Variovorax]|jgi:tight adherence protein B|uniref:type II secretion system F family protein n=1 Tax=unclassified Variovorax TaxID=663243 RepID=UPI0008BD831D|nr:MULTISPECIES: type II secretion system F family protein [unclassified Variovorax]SEK16474.1 tight adherence protein B [Variovorax sp. OK202]SFE48935.1 tight adherence protein B [Variovorax sp. OK212]